MEVLNLIYTIINDAVARMRRVCTVVVAVVALSAVVVMGQDKDLDAELVTITKSLTKLRSDVQSVDGKLEGAQRKLQDLMRRQAPYADIQFQKERIRMVQREKLKLVDQLLEAQQQRADILVRMKEAEQAKKTAAADATVPDGATDATTPTDPKTGDPKAGDPLLASSPTLMPTTPAAMTADEYKKALALLQGSKDSLLADIEAYTAKRKQIEDEMAALPKNTSKATLDKYRKTIAEYKAGADLAKTKLATVTREIAQLKKNFETYMSQKSRDDFVMPGQKLELIVAEDKSFNGEYTVRERGYIILDRVGRVMVAGKTREDAELAVKEALEKEQLRIATVLLEKARLDDPDEQTKELQREYLKARIRAITKERADIGQDVIYLYGAFKTPGPWPIPKNFQPTLLTTLIRCGGTTKEADLSSIRVMRMADGKSNSEKVDIKALMEGKGDVMDMKLQPNDIVIAPESTKKTQQNVYLTGSVKNPGAFSLSFDKPVTTYTVILKAGGVSRFANLSKVYILREKSKPGEKTKIPVDLKKIKEGKLTDPELKPNDIIVVPESFWGTGS